MKLVHRLKSLDDKIRVARGEELGGVANVEQGAIGSMHPSGESVDGAVTF